MQEFFVVCTNQDNILTTTISQITVEAGSRRSAGLFISFIEARASRIDTLVGGVK